MVFMRPRSPLRKAWWPRLISSDPNQNSKGIHLVWHRSWKFHAKILENANFIANLAKLVQAYNNTRTEIWPSIINMLFNGNNTTILTSFKKKSCKIRKLLLYYQSILHEKSLVWCSFADLDCPRWENVGILQGWNFLVNCYLGIMI